MRKFSFYDFIKYNSPCFNCNSNTVFDIGIVDVLENTTFLIKTNVFKDHTIVDLKINYHNKLSLTIYHKTNVFVVSSMARFSEFIKNHLIYLSKKCRNCLSLIESSFVTFNTKTSLVSAVTISKELLCVNNDTMLYQIFSFYTENTSKIVMQSLDSTSNSSSFELETKLLPLYSFKSKEHLLSKLKLYTLFS